MTDTLVFAAPLGVLGLIARGWSCAGISSNSCEIVLR